MQVMTVIVGLSSCCRFCAMTRRIGLHCRIRHKTSTIESFSEISERSAMGKRLAARQRKKFSGMS
jgi:hypothetical protein